MMITDSTQKKNGVQRKNNFKIQLNAEKCWKQFCDKIDSDLWGKRYQIAMRNLKVNANIEKK